MTTRPSLEYVIARLAATGRLPQLNVVQIEGGRYQASLQRGRTSAFGVSVKDTAIEAIFDALGPGYGTTWEAHLDGKPAKPETRYFYHPESDSLFTTTNGSDGRGGDPLCEEISRKRYYEIMAKRADDLI